MLPETVPETLNPAPLSVTRGQQQRAPLKFVRKADSQASFVGIRPALARVFNFML